MDLERVDRITADTVGEPGNRTFYIQARQDEQLVTILVEKQQVQLLAASILEVLARVGAETGPGPDEADMGLEQPIDPLWRAGRLSIGYEDDADRILLEMEEIVPDGDEDAPEVIPDRVRLWASREQMLSLARHGAMVAERGRPACELCGNPMDPEGHICPATNGHRKLGGS
jgi:uncharacterized repeat protein (TIGR03847 family)